MTHNDDPPWLRPPPVVVLPASTDGKKSSQVSISSGAAPKANSPPTFPPTTRNSENTSSLTLLPSPQIASAGPSSSRAEDDEEQYTGWRPQQMTAQQIAHTPPLSPLDLAMYPGAPAISDPAAARRAVAGLRPLRILSSRRPGGPASAGPSRPPSVEATNSATRSSFMGFFSAAKRASVTTLAVSIRAGFSDNYWPDNFDFPRAPHPLHPEEAHNRHRFRIHQYLYHLSLRHVPLRLFQSSHWVQSSLLRWSLH